MTTPRIDLAELRRTLGASTVARYFDDDGDGEADSEVVQTFIRRGTARADGLLSTFRPEVLTALQDDDRFIDLICWITLGLACQRRPEWMLPNGTFPYGLQKKEAEAELLSIAKGLDKFALEKNGAGENEAAMGSHSSTEVEPPLFAASAYYPRGRGGF